LKPNERFVDEYVERECAMRTLRTHKARFFFRLESVGFFLRPSPRVLRDMFWSNRRRAIINIKISNLFEKRAVTIHIYLYDFGGRRPLRLLL